MNFSRNGSSIYIEKQLDRENKIVLRAENIRKQTTGVHARLFILRNNSILAWTVDNVEKDSNRVRLSNSAHKRLPEDIASIYVADSLKQDLDFFCRHLWDEHMAVLAPELIIPDEAPIAPEFFLKPYVVKGGGTILFGQPKRGKSYISQLMAVSIDAGVSEIWETTQANVLFVNLERSHLSIRRRLANVNLALGLDPTRPLLVLNQRGRSLSDVEDSIAKAIAEKEVKVLFLDSISRAGFGDLTQNEPVNRIVDTLNNLCETWIGLAHTPRASSEHTYGSIHFDAGADILVRLTAERQADSMGVSLKMMDQNDLPTAPPSTYKLLFDDVGLKGITNARIQDFPSLESEAEMSLSDLIEEYLLNDCIEGADSATGIADAIKKQRSQISRVLITDKRFVRIGQTGRQVLYGIKSTMPA